VAKAYFSPECLKMPSVSLQNRILQTSTGTPVADIAFI
jgi:hypothetical protein